MAPHTNSTFAQDLDNLIDMATDMKTRAPSHSDEPELGNLMADSCTILPSTPEKLKALTDHFSTSCVLVGQPDNPMQQMHKTTGHYVSTISHPIFVPIDAPTLVEEIKDGDEGVESSPQPQFTDPFWQPHKQIPTPASSHNANDNETVGQYGITDTEPAGPPGPWVPQARHLRDNVNSFSGTPARVQYDTWVPKTKDLRSEVSIPPRPAARVPTHSDTWGVPREKASPRTAPPSV